MAGGLERLRAALPERVTTDPAARSEASRDAWVMSELDALEDTDRALPAAVVEPTSTEEVAAALRICREERIAVVTRGGGSGVCGGVRASRDEVVLSTRALAGRIELEERDLVACFRAGTNAMVAENAVREHGLTIGHWPQSIELASVGGLVATRSAGQLSTGYGNVEELVFALEAVLPSGDVLRTAATPRASAGPDLRQLFLGSEGLFGVITEVAFSLRPLPEASEGQAFHFADLGGGLDAVRTALREGWRPAVVRLYDAAESARNFPGVAPDGRVQLLLLHEGTKRAVEAQRAGLASRCAGGAEADPVVVSRWLEHRNRVPGFRVFLEQGVVVDTIEVAATWSRVERLYRRALAALEPVEGLLFASAHSSHSYRSGTNLYFTFAVRPPQRSAMRAAYRACWSAVLDAALAEGGGIAHHHGIGRVRRDWLAREIGPTGIALLHALKAAVDPENLFNPGVLLPEGSA